ncbi:MAG: NAD(P)H-binding protein [Gammaproteobacteria bacterium]|jgi:uncharacterized protein YbjT (DUF2867 family)|nr:NAD(P)H-binding protein [Gammaproteobacteria bacterium]MDP6617787.1 NAD(P)H-binding protein [Gammaproteobacteria bacterium]MDP6694173.1 NAD(P)H-binding protein [Gammaproteobacteria bacterium]MDP7041609.1 NAD(P)H-binding protein [Gammaproteobacteria bacterium]
MAGDILIFGATRGTGFEAAKILREKGEAVTALVRPGSDSSALEELGVTLFRGDVLDPESVADAFASGDYRAAIVSLAGKRGERPRPDGIGANHITDAAGDTHVLMITGIGAGDSQGAVAPKVLEVLGEVLGIKGEAEEYLMQSGRQATILRPGGMTNDPASGTAVKTEDHSVMGVINRADLAQLTVDCIDDPDAVGKIYHTIDPEITWKAPLERGEDLPPTKS